MDRFTFDDDYVRRLREHDARTEEHFFYYFRARLFDRLRSRVRSYADLEDVAQTTLTRVLQLVYDGKVRQAGALFGLVLSVCGHVLQEHYRKINRLEPIDDDPPDPAPDPVDDLITRENQRRVRVVLDELNPKDAKILRAVFIDERPRDEVCREFEITSANLRVLLHRALKHFRERFPPDDETK